MSDILENSAIFITVMFATGLIWFMPIGIAAEQIERSDREEKLSHRPETFWYRDIILKDSVLVWKSDSTKVME
tara:strand:- start:303 stop:521 length:219 start_codon:yes stop_codon:yes gene_type:complete